MTISEDDVTKLAAAIAKAQGHPQPAAFAENVAHHFGLKPQPAKASPAKAPRPTKPRKVSKKH